jgi:hypothetical protein
MANLLEGLDFPVKKESEPNLDVTTATILLVDRNASLAIEKVNDSNERFTEAVGLSSYSTSQLSSMWMRKPRIGTVLFVSCDYLALKCPGCLESKTSSIPTLSPIYCPA